jgi:asparagine synthase (glutamine-hydrolysing)
MCGIAGFAGDFQRELLDQMNSSMSHRGPDDSGTLLLQDDRVGLTHRRLSIIDLSSRGHQPMWDSTRQVVISYNGEIYNYQELRAQLESDGFEFRSDSDTEVILNMYLKYGEGVLSRLNGIFAFALWDEKEHALLVARDGFGVKPLYYAETEAGFVFSSEIKALLQCEQVDRELDLNAVHHYMTYLWCPAPRTMLRRVKKLEPGHVMWIHDGRVEKKWSFFDLPLDRAIIPIPRDEAAAQVRDAVQTAVDRQMVSDVPIGALLSGGLDSSSVVACARKSYPDQDFSCFTIGFKDAAFAEEGTGEDLPFAQRVAKHLNVDLKTIYVGPEMADELAHMIYYLDEPQADFAAINTFFICRLARENGIKVLLSGAGGDDIFSGYRRHQALLWERRWSWMPKVARRGLKAATSLLPAKSASGRRVVKAFAYADRDGDERLASYFHWAEPDILLGLYSDAMREKIESKNFSVPLMDSLSRISSDVDSLNRMLYLEGKHFLADHNLNYFDKMSMATGVEVRVPLLDPDLVALAGKLPAGYKHFKGEGKWILKAAMKDLLPKDVIYRTKSGFGVPLRHWLRSELREMVEDTLSRESLESRGLFDHGAVQRLLEADRSGAIDAAYTILSLICIELWCRMFLDSAQPTPP